MKPDKKPRFTYDDIARAIAKEQEYKKDIKYERNFPQIVMESSPNKDKLKYAVQQ